MKGVLFLLAMPIPRLFQGNQDIARDWGGCLAVCYWVANAYLYIAGLRGFLHAQGCKRCVLPLRRYVSKAGWGGETGALMMGTVRSSKLYEWPSGNQVFCYVPGGRDCVLSRQRPELKTQYIYMGHERYLNQGQKPAVAA